MQYQYYMHLIYQIYNLTYSHWVFCNSTSFNISKCHFSNAICIKIAHKLCVRLHGRGGAFSDLAFTRAWALARAVTVPCSMNFVRISFHLWYECDLCESLYKDIHTCNRKKKCSVVSNLKLWLRAYHFADQSVYMYMYCIRVHHMNTLLNVC